MVATIQLAITLGASLGGLLFDMRGYQSTFSVERRPAVRGGLSGLQGRPSGRHPLRSEHMRATILYGPRDVRVEDRPDPAILEPTDAIIRIAAACVCGSDLWPYRGVQTVHCNPRRWATSTAASSRRWARRSGRSGRASSWSVRSPRLTTRARIAATGISPPVVHREFMSGAQAPMFRVPLADGTLVATADTPPDHLIPSLLATSDVLGTGWFAADAANVKPGATVAVVGDGAVGLLGVLSAKQMGAERIIAMSRHPARQTARARVRRHRHRH